ncbi:hypothetical protein [Arcobacter sp.]|uniref:hypothetical protein n=1 Tax=Arcobacter sp. TaxID=1872629 RepID=UPI003D143BEF
MEKFAFVALTFLFSMILIDYILIINGMSSYQLLFKSSYLYGPYATKPLGLFGQFSINSTYAVFFYLLYLSFSEIKGINSKKVILFLMTSFIIIVENSGSGYISFLLMIFVMIYNKLKNKLFLIFLTSISIFILIYFNLLQKISLKYISFLIEKVFVDNLMMHFNDIKTPFDLLLGTGSQYMDFGPLYIIGSIGLIVFLIYTLVLIYFLIKVKCLYMKTAIMSLILGNIHYPTLFFPIMNVLLPILFIYYINKHTMKNMIDNNV